MRVQILVKNLDGETAALDVEDTDTLESVKQRIGRSQKVSTSEFTILFKNNPCDLTSTVNGNRIVNGSTLVMRREETEEEKNGFSYKKTWPNGIFDALKKFNKTSAPNEIWERIKIELDRGVYENRSFKWNLDKLCVTQMGLINEMDWLEAHWNMENPYFAEEQRKTIIDLIRWNYIYLFKANQTEEGLGKQYTDTVLSRSYELVLKDYREPKILCVLERNASLKLCEQENDNFVFDTLSFNKVEEARKRELDENQKKLRAKKQAKDMTGRAELNENIQRCKNQALNLNNGYFNYILDFGNGLGGRTSTIKSLEIKGELVFRPFFTRVHKDYINSLEQVDLFKSILTAFNMCSGIECIKFNLSYTTDPEQYENILKILQEIQKNDNLKYKLKYLDLSGFYITSEIITVVLQLVTDSSLEHLALNNCKIVDHGLDLISNALSNSSIVSIELRGNGLGNENVKMLLKKFVNCKFLKRLDISHNPIGNELEEDIKNLIRKTGITSLNLSYTNIVKRGLNSILNFAATSQLEYINIDGNSLQDVGQNYSTFGKVICCDFWRFWPKCGNSACCIAVSNCFAIKAHQKVHADPEHTEKAKKINTKAELVQLKKQLDRNIEELLEEKQRRLKQSLTLGALREKEDYEAEQKRLREEKQELEEWKQFELDKAKKGASNMVSMNINTSNSINDNKLMGQNSIQDVANADKESDKPKALEGVQEEEEEYQKKTKPNPSDPANIIEKAQEFAKNMEMG